MSSTIDDYFLSLAAATPLPTTEPTQDNPPLQSPIRRRPQTRSQTSSILQPPLNIQLPSHSSTPVATKNLPSSKKRKPSFTIFVDADASSIATPARRTSRPKRSRTSSTTTTTTSTTPRTPLSDRTYSSNSTPAPSPRLPDTPFTFSPEDPYWENIENYSPFCSTGLATPPVTPSPSTSSSPPPPSSNMVRSLRPRTPTATSSSSSPLTTLIPPANMLVYNMLGLSTWRVTPDTIASAYRRRAASLHPDKAAAGASGEREKELATLTMQQLVAARDLLLDRKRRGRYHRDGVVPWVI